MTIKRNCMTKADAVIIAAIEAGVPSLVEARVLVDQFHDMIRKKDEAKLDVWIANAKTSLVSSLATGVLKAGNYPPAKPGAYMRLRKSRVFRGVFFAAFSIGQLPLLRTSYVRLNNARRLSAFMA